MADVVKSVFRQRKVEGEYVNAFIGKKFLLKNIISDEILGKYEVEIPLLKQGEYFFLADIEKEVIIQSRVRSSDGSVVYYVRDEVVEKESESVPIEEYNSLKKEFEKYKKEYKYKHRFFNFD